MCVCFVVVFGSVWFGLVRFGSVRFGSVRTTTLVMHAAAVNTAFSQLTTDRPIHCVVYILELHCGRW